MVERAFAMISLLYQGLKMQLLTRRISFFVFQFPTIPFIQETNDWMVFSVLHPGVHFWHNRQSQGYNAQSRRGECQRIIQQYFRIFPSRWPTRQYRTRIYSAGITELSRFSPTCLSLMWPDRWWTSSSSCPRCPEHGRWWLFLWFYGHFNPTVGRDLLFCGQGRA